MEMPSFSPISFSGILHRRILSTLARARLPSSFVRVSNTTLISTFVPNGKLTRTQRFQVFNTLRQIIERVEAQTASYSFECGLPSRQVENYATSAAG